MPGWLTPVLYFGLGLLALGSVILLGLAVTLGANRNRPTPTRKGRNHKNGNPS